jgi:hypothetical protein
LDLRVEVERAMARILALPTEQAVRREVESLNAKITAANRSVTSGPSTSIAKVDIEAIVARWRTQRAPGAR